MRYLRVSVWGELCGSRGKVINAAQCTESLGEDGRVWDDICSGRQAMVSNKQAAASTQVAGINNLLLKCCLHSLSPFYSPLRGDGTTAK